MKGVAILYRWSVAAQHQRHFVAQWRTTARDLRRSGALGCHLLSGDNDQFVALVRWPSDYARVCADKELAIQSLPGIRALAKAQLTVEDDATTSMTKGLLS